MLKIFTWPFALAGGIISLILSAIGRLFAFGMGASISVIGVLLSMSIIGLVIGVPLVLFGGGLMVRSVWP